MSTTATITQSETKASVADVKLAGVNDHTVQATDIDRTQCKRVKEMKVLVLGLGRTGTSSIRQALAMLGYSQVYHMASCMNENPRDCEMWTRAFDAKYEGKGEFGKEQWDQLLGHCEAVTDFPASVFAQELMAAYPDAKVILSTRNIDSWYSSVETTIYKSLQSKARWLGSFVDEKVRLQLPVSQKTFEHFFYNDFPRFGKRVFEEHNEMVRKTATPGNFLEFQCKEGWAPLCEFLGKDVPDVPFPSGNQREVFQQRIAARDSALWGKVALTAAEVAGAVAVLGYAYTRFARK